MNSNRKYKRAMFFIPFAILGILLMGFVTMQLWNWLIPIIFHLTAITFWQALGLFALGRILFGGFHFNRHPKRFDNPAFREKFMNLSPEEKEKFKQQWKNKCSNQ